jgi:hypothetical protein
VIRTVLEFISEVQRDLSKWQPFAAPWFRGESGSEPALLPRIATRTAEYENYCLQTFRRQAGGFQNTPQRKHTDLWLFWAQHYGVPTRLLDWTEGALVALYFAVNQSKPSPRVYMLNPHCLNELATSAKSDGLNYPLSWDGVGRENIALAWEERNPSRGFVLPIAMPATYQDHRMIAQRSCFTVHGKSLESLDKVVLAKAASLEPYLMEYRIDSKECSPLISALRILGISHSSVFPDLDHLGKDIALKEI